MYDGNDTACTTCTEHFRNGHKCVRLECNRIFHEECFMQALTHYIHNSRRSDGPEVDCPNYRAPGVVKAMIPFTGARTIQYVLNTPTDQRGNALGRPSSGPPNAAGSPVVHHHDHLARLDLHHHRRAVEDRRTIRALGAIRKSPCTLTRRSTNT